ncbi:MAG: MaoC family dehydratase [Alphaproteobacteria bacterium]
MTRYFEDLTVGMAAEAKRVVSEADVAAFAAVSGDHNPVHMDAAYAAATPFRARIAHGALIASFVSALMASEVPGPGGIYISQTVNFRRPVKIGDEVTTKVSIAALDPAKSYVTIALECSVGGRVVMDGEALVIVPRKRRVRASV